MTIQAGFQDLLKSNKTYNPDEIVDVLRMVEPQLMTVTTNTKHSYYNIPCSFDIETSSFFRTFGNRESQKCACMYEWTFGIGGAVIIGRTWQQFKTMIDTVVNYLGLSPYTRLLCTVHNLSYEFQFLRKRFKWERVFSNSERKPIYALSSVGIEFRCSYLLSGYSLAKLGENLTKFKVEKLVGFLDYDKIRHSKTPLTENELAYCANDVRVVMAYMQEQIDECGDISKIPLTKTGFVRRYCKESCFYERGVSRKKSRKRQRYREIIKGLRLTVDEYRQLERAFQGGFTHANPFYTNKIVENVTSFDFTSAYPFVMVAERFPMSSSEKVTITSMDEFKKNLKLYCCLFDVEFIGLESKVFYDSYISRSRCFGCDNAVVNNGRVVRADRLCTTLTDVDYSIIEQCYSWKEIHIRDFRRYKRGYLPTDFVKSILTLYANKTKLKNVSGKEVEYLRSKEMVNSCYGMIVTSVLRDMIIYENDEWGKSDTDVEKAIKDYNNDPSRFLFYPWGVWVTAYCRRNLWTGIFEFGSDYVYSDTDSIKVRNAENHVEYINAYNVAVHGMLERACKYHGIDLEMTQPSTVKGVKKPLGVWDFDGHYSRFKTLGAKRYMVEYSDDPRNDDRGKINITVSGLNKKICVPYLKTTYGSKIFESFTNDLYIPPSATGKNTHTYIDEERRGTVTDYLGNVGEFDELSAVHLMESDYSLSLSREYLNYFMDIQETWGEV